MTCAKPGEGPAEEARRHGHTAGRGRPEHHHEGQPRRHRRERREHEGRQRAAPGQPVHHPHQQGSNKGVVPLFRRIRDRQRGTTPPCCLDDCPAAEDDQHGGHHQLERGGRVSRHLALNDDEGGAHHDERERVTEAPPDPKHRRAAAAALVADQGRDRGEMVRLERVAQADERGEAGAEDNVDHEFEDVLPV